MEFIILKNKLENEKGNKTTKEKINFFIEELNGYEAEYLYSKKIHTEKGKENIEGIGKCVVKKENEFLVIYEGENKGIKISIKIMESNKKETIFILAKEKTENEKIKQITLEIKEVLEYYLKKRVMLIWKKESEMNYVKKKNKEKEEQEKIKVIMHFLQEKEKHYYDYEIHGNFLTKEFLEEFEKIKKQIKEILEMKIDDYTVKTSKLDSFLKRRILTEIDEKLLLYNEVLYFSYLCGEEEIINIELKPKITFGKDYYFEDENGEEIKFYEIKSYLEKKLREWKERNLFDISIRYAYEEWEYQMNKLLEEKEDRGNEISSSYENVLKFFKDSPIKLFDFLMNKKSVIIEMELAGLKKNIWMKEIEKEWLVAYKVNEIKIEKIKDKNEVKKIINSMVEGMF